MPDETKIMNTEETKETADMPIADVATDEIVVPPAVEKIAEKAQDRGARRERGGGGRRGGKRQERSPRAKPEFDNKMLAIRRVARVVAGGRRFNFSVAIVVGNRKGQVGVGIGKAGDTALAIDKATRDAKKHMISVKTNKEMSIPHQVVAKYSSARIMIQPAKDRGLVAGSAARTVLELAGVTNVTAKIFSPSKNKLNIARATIEALRSLDLQRPTHMK